MNELYKIKKNLLINEINYINNKNKNNIICINIGCDNKVSIIKYPLDPGGISSLKIECLVCSESRKKNINLPNIIFHKKTYCENKDGIFGFLCPMDNTRYSEFSSEIYHLKYLDNDHSNNSLENIKTFCLICNTCYYM